MAENSKIEWTDHTVNLWWGCAKVHTGCTNCYAEHFSDVRYKNNLWGEKTLRKRIKSAFTDLDKYQEQAKNENRTFKIFCGSMMDIFEDSKELLNPFEHNKQTQNLRFELFRKIEFGEYNNLIFLLLTKRPENIYDQVPIKWWYNMPKNVWLGTSISDQATANKQVELLTNFAPNNLFLSIEPQVGDIWSIDLSQIKWVIQGGESGPKKRPFELHWAYDMKRMCKEAGVPYFFKQIDKIQPIPEDLMIREFPKFS